MSTFPVFLLQFQSSKYNKLDQSSLPALSRICTKYCTLLYILLHLVLHANVKVGTKIVSKSAYNTTPGMTMTITLSTHIYMYHLLVGFKYFNSNNVFVTFHLNNIMSTLFYFPSPLCKNTVLGHCHTPFTLHHRHN